MESKKRNRGFTLLEISLVLAVIGILALLSAHPMKNYLRRLDFRSSSRNIKRLIQTGQSKAMANPNLHIGVFFDLTGSPNQAFLFQDRINPQSYQYDGIGDSLYLQPEKLKKGITFTALAGYPDEVVFRGDGSAWKSLKIILTDGILSDTLDVLASTGRVRVGN
jgi:prepilin-type N-terminal cleavage/methylation domain-containing protein